jgi:hypothetical protein
LTFAFCFLFTTKAWRWHAWTDGIGIDEQVDDYGKFDGWEGIKRTLVIGIERDNGQEHERYRDSD